MKDTRLAAQGEEEEIFHCILSMRIQVFRKAETEG